MYILIAEASISFYVDHDTTDFFEFRFFVFPHKIVGLKLVVNPRFVDTVTIHAT